MNTNNSMNFHIQYHINHSNLERKSTIASHRIASSLRTSNFEPNRTIASVALRITSLHYYVVVPTVLHASQSSHFFFLSDVPATEDLIATAWALPGTGLVAQCTNYIQTNNSRLLCFRSLLYLLQRTNPPRRRGRSNFTNSTQ